MPRRPISAPCFAAASVPECQMFLVPKEAKKNVAKKGDLEKGRKK